MHLNLARTWRSKHFGEVVGQPLVIRLVKNSLYRNLIFPVYLLSGMRGCGKTSVARIFAAALNCEALDQFPKESSRAAATMPYLQFLHGNAKNEPS